ncbi:MAG TPA: gamma-glutamyl-gamma-aminobutyrate hydrolase family protein [Candidatus Limnocylindrales bacterium]|nr:gamma-glutamyl-gamma-aminobutyrate hydrolase family protein [Candidatus Limnocylindrales bacterium]
MKPLIGIPTFHDRSAADKMPERYGMSRPYIIALEAAGAAPVLLPLALGEDTLMSIFERLDGLFLAGGGDVNPSRYGVTAHEKTHDIDDLRDFTELRMAQWALDRDLPLLGVCRGIQTMNVAAGGTLLQDVIDLVPQAIRHQYAPEKPRSFVAHDLMTISDTRLAAILGPKARVNSFHHQAVERPGAGFVVSALAPDGVIEALEGRGQRFTIGVQWHPEGLIESDPSMLRLFQTFVHAA